MPVTVSTCSGLVGTRPRALFRTTSQDLEKLSGLFGEQVHDNSFEIAAEVQEAFTAVVSGVEMVSSEVLLMLSG